MVTDTLPFRNPDYHGEDDLPDALQFDRLALVASGLLAMVRELASGGDI
jgi:hypothetical protein